MSKSSYYNRTKRFLKDKGQEFFAGIPLNPEEPWKVILWAGRGPHSYPWCEEQADSPEKLMDLIETNYDKDHFPAGREAHTYFVVNANNGKVIRIKDFISQYRKVEGETK